MKAGDAIAEILKREGIEICVAQAEGYAAFFMRASDLQLSVIARSPMPISS